MKILAIMSADFAGIICDTSVLAQKRRSSVPKQGKKSGKNRKKGVEGDGKFKQLPIYLQEAREGVEGTVVRAPATSRFTQFLFGGEGRNGK